MKKLALLGLTMVMSISLHAEVKGAIGVAGEHIRSVYDGVDTHTKFIPMIFLQHQNYYAEGTRFGAYLYNDCVYSVGGGLSIDFSSIDRNENDLLKEMEELTGRANLNLGLKRKGEFVDIMTNIDMDISDASKGFRVKTQVSKLMEFDALSLEPKLGVVWSDKKTNEYLYGVSDAQATAKYSAYTPDDSFEPYIELGLKYRITKLLGIIAATKYTKLSDTVIDSPMVDREEELTARLGLLFFFKL